MRPYFSIILPTFNRGYILWKTIQSVQSQEYSHWELLIIDDGSTDSTEQVVAQFQEDSRITYHKMPHSGAQKARNYGMELAKGTHISYLDSDDSLQGTFLSTAVSYFKQYPEGVFTVVNYNHRIEKYNDKHILEKLIVGKTSEVQNVTIKDFFHRNVVPRTSGILHTREVIEDGIRWDVELKRFQDWDFVLALGTHYPKRFFYIPVVLFEYSERYGIDGITANSTYYDWSEGFEAIYQKYKNHTLMKGQTWYPYRVKKYADLHKKNFLPGALF